jgi:hypothetical protein
MLSHQTELQGLTICIPPNFKISVLVSTYHHALKESGVLNWTNYVEHRSDTEFNSCFLFSSRLYEDFSRDSFDDRRWVMGSWYLCHFLAYLGNMFALHFFVINFSLGVENYSFLINQEKTFPWLVSLIGRTTALCILGTDMHVWTVKCTNFGFNEFVKVHLSALPATTFQLFCN